MEFEDEICSISFSITAYSLFTILSCRVGGGALAGGIELVRNTVRSQLNVEYRGAYKVTKDLAPWICSMGAL